MSVGTEQVIPHQGDRPLTIAMVGTRGVPAAYGGFETAVEEVGRRLVERGHQVVVYARGGDSREPQYLGMKVVHLPAVPQKQLETLSHTAFSAVHAITRRKPDVAFVFNAANSPFVPLFRLRGIPVALHMDGLEWRRSKWGKRGRAYYRWAESHGVRVADALISDAPGIGDYYTHQFGVPTELIRYGAPILESASSAGISALGLGAGEYHLVVARFEPENHVLEIVKGYARSRARLPLVVVGSAPYSASYTQEIRDAAGDDPRIRFLGGVYDQELLDALYFHARTYAHGHSVGGTNPSLLRAMGAATAVIAYDVPFNREVLDDRAWFFTDHSSVEAHYSSIEEESEMTGRFGQLGQDRARTAFQWDDVADSYAALALRLADGESVHRIARKSRRAEASWPADE